MVYGELPLQRTKDHIRPKIKGGNDEKRNIVYCCFGCNQSKGGLTLETWKGYLNRKLRPHQGWKRFTWISYKSSIIVKNIELLQSLL